MTNKVIFIYLAMFLFGCLSFMPHQVESQIAGIATSPLLSLNNRTITQAELEALPDSGIFIKQALLFIFTGSYNGTSGADSALSALDENNLDLMLDAGIQVLASVLDEQEGLSDEDKKSVYSFFL
jgi:hypothetical protein